MAALFKVKALYEFEAKEDDDLGFPVAQIIDVTEEIDDNWLEGKYTDASGSTQSGIFPREFVEKYEPEVPTRPARPARVKQDTAPVAESTAPVLQHETPDEEEDTPPVSAVSKPQPVPGPADLPPAVGRDEIEPRSPPAVAPAKSEPPPAPRPTPAQPAAPASGKKPPPVAAKSNAFRDRIAAFNQPAAAPIAPMVPGGSKPQPTFIKKPFVAPPPMANAYVPPPKVEPVHKPYIRDEDPEIKRRQEEDRSAAEAAGLTSEPSAEQAEDDEDAPKPTSLKERIARLQQQQMEQAQRRAEGGHKKEKKPPAKKFSDSSDQPALAADEGEPVERQRSIDNERQSLDVARDKPRVPSAQRQPTEPMSPVPTAPDHELVSDGNEADQSAAGETTEDDADTVGPEDSDEKHAPVAPPRAVGASRRDPDVSNEEGTIEDAEDDEEDSMDEETRRRVELRERMAKMSGGMGMAGMFGPPGGMPLPGGAPKKRTTKEKRPSEEEQPFSASPPTQRVPMIPIPGMNRVQSPDSDVTETVEEKAESATGDHDNDDDIPTILPSRKSTTEERGPPPPVPRDSRPSLERGAPPVPGSSRPVPAPPTVPMPPDSGSESDDEASIHASKSTADTSSLETPGPLPVRPASVVASALPISGSVQQSSTYSSSDPNAVTSDKRASRPPPPIPGSEVTGSRPPPPPPPTARVSRSATMHEDDEERGESEYEGDYDTDIASSAKHKDALKAHVREPSLDDSTTADETPLSPPVPPAHAPAPRAVPPPPPPQSAPRSRPSMDAPRAPPPIPPTSQLGASDADEEYDPYRYDPRQNDQISSNPTLAAHVTGSPPRIPAGVAVTSPLVPRPEPSARGNSVDEQYPITPPRTSMEQVPPQPPRERAAPPPPPQELPPSRAPPRQSLDVQRSNTTARRSGEQPRPSGEHGQIANDIDLGENTQWYTAVQPLPPVLQSRNGIDILSECEVSTTSKRGGRTTVSKDIYVLFIDYSQTIITVQYDSKEPSDAHLEQRHIAPPPKLRQDQLEAYWQRFGRKIAEKANFLGQHKESPVGDGSPNNLVSELMKEQQDALQPVGQRAYGALVYANLANASTMQFDEIRPGDIVTLRNTRFEGSHGAMKHKYKQEYGPSHVAVVEEWDGTRRAIRGWEQGREKKEKVRSEKFRLGDLKSGEVRVWRVVGRDWVDWQS